MPLVNAPDNVKKLKQWVNVNVDNAKVNFGTRNVSRATTKTRRKRKSRRRRKSRTRRFRTNQ